MDAKVRPLRTILVAIDGSADAALAARIAADLAARSGAALHLIHTWTPPPAAGYPYPSVPTASAQRQYEAAAQGVVSKAVGDLAASGAKIAATHLHCGPAVGSIASLGAELRADVIVLGSRGLGPLRRLILGSVSSGLAHEATRPVLIVRGSDRAWPPRAVVVGDDGTAAAQSAAAMAASVARLYDATLALVHARSPLPRDPAAGGEAMIRYSVGMAAPGSAPAEPPGDEYYHRAAELLSEHAVALRGQGIARVEPEIVLGDPAAAIVAAAEAADPALVAVGSRGLGALDRLRLGSVSTKVLHATVGPVLIVPQRGNGGAID